MKHVTDVVTEIRAASRQQSEGIGQVTQAVTQMDEVTQQMPRWSNKQLQRRRRYRSRL